MAARKKAAKKKAARRKSGRRKKTLAEIIEETPLRFITQQDYYPWFEEDYLWLMDDKRNVLAKITRYGPAKKFEIEKYKKNIHPRGWTQLLARASHVFEYFKDGTPIEKAKYIPPALRPYVEYIVWRRGDRAEHEARRKEHARRRARLKAKEERERKKG